MEKLLKAKKAQKLQKGVTVAVTIIVTVVVLFTVFASLVPEAQNAGDEFSFDVKCAEAGCFINSTLTPTCVINSSLEGTGACENPIETVPLASLFGGSGVIILLLLVVLFLGVLKLVMPSSRK